MNLKALFKTRAIFIPLNYLIPTSRSVASLFSRSIAFVAVEAVNLSAAVSDNVEDVIDDIWNNAGDSSALESDEFSDILDDIFNTQSSL